MHDTFARILMAREPRRRRPTDKRGQKFLQFVRPDGGARPLAVHLRRSLLLLLLPSRLVAGQLFHRFSICTTPRTRNGDIMINNNICT